MFVLTPIKTDREIHGHIIGLLALYHQNLFYGNRLIYSSSIGVSRVLSQIVSAPFCLIFRNNGWGLSQQIRHQVPQPNFVWFCGDDIIKDPNEKCETKFCGNNLIHKLVN